MIENARKAIYPFLIFKEAWSVCRKNLAKLVATYLMFYFPYLVFVAAANLIAGDQSRILDIIAIVIGLLSGITLLIAANKAARGERVEIGKSLIEAKKHFLNYLGVAVLIFCAILGLAFAGVLLGLVGFSLTAKISIVLAVALWIIVFGAALCFIVYFMIRWALGGAATIIEGMRPIAALKRSKALIKSYVNPVIGEYLLWMMAFLLASVPYMIVLVMFGNPQDGTEAELLLGAVNNIVVNSIMMPFMSVIVAVMFRKLKEAIE